MTEEEKRAKAIFNPVCNVFATDITNSFTFVKLCEQSGLPEFIVKAVLISLIIARLVEQIESNDVYYQPCIENSSFRWTGKVLN